LSDYLTMVEVLTIHSVVIDEFGGSDGIRDLGALEAAVFRPQTGYYEDAIAEAAALFESLIQNHPFIDGNNRTALGAMDVHLRMNGVELGGSSGDHHRFIVELLEQGELDWKPVDGWLRANVESATSGVASDFSVSSRDEWSDRARRQGRIGQDLNSPLTEEESNWLDRDLDG
jgi:death on curing protein